MSKPAWGGCGTLALPWLPKAHSSARASPGCLQQARKSPWCHQAGAPRPQSHPATEQPWNSLLSESGSIPTLQSHRGQLQRASCSPTASSIPQLPWLMALGPGGKVPALFRAAPAPRSLEKDWEVLGSSQPGWRALPGPASPGLTSPTYCLVFRALPAPNI